jgi:hypothetical protein
MVCDPNANIPKTCSEAFQHIAVGQAEIGRDVKNLMEAAAVTNGHIEKLYDRVGSSEADRMIIHKDLTQIMDRGTKRSDKFWTFALGVLVTVVGGVAVTLILARMGH